MSIRIGSNVPSLIAQRRLSEGSAKYQVSVERLSSGLRINKASDDSAGLAISTQLSSQTKVYTQAIRNANDGISLLSIADSAVSSLTDIATRIKELAGQAANGAYSLRQRSSLDQEAQALSSEYLRIVQSTKFNNVNLLNGSLSTGSSIQLGYGSENSILASVGGRIGTGTFQTQVTQSSSVGISDHAIGDVNRDGYLDMVYTQATQVFLGLGRGDGTFSPYVTAAGLSMETTGIAEVALADTNNDGNLDIITTGTGGGSGRFTIRLGNGDGTFGSAVSYVTQTTSSSSLSIGDLNADGKIDVVTYGVSAGSGNVIGFLGNGDGTFSNYTGSIAFDTSPYDMELSDINSDGKLDIVTIGQSTGTANILTRLGNGDGSFGSVITNVLGGGISLTEVKLADFNSDGIVDVAAISGSNLYIRNGLNNGLFSGTGSYASAVTSLSDLAIGDINGDGHLDIIEGGGNAYSRLGSGDGTFSAATALQTTNAARVELVDLNNDGVLDISASYSNIFGSLLGRYQDGSAPLLSLSLKTRSDALQALTDMTNKINQLTLQRGTIGSSLARLSYGISNLASLNENLTSANSRIIDVDVAEESATLINSQILQNASTAILAQANQQPALALTLLTNSS